ncbi:MAG: sigma-54-dependent Fis family transcriptional regulator [Candidatus Sumerlaeia bacterium]|nr:sigma-54-dependent Fis family transcriptional regulator [Candidatus Sumerlaeia bacterium]
MTRKILIVDDEKNTREGLRWALESQAADILLAADGEQALLALGEQPVDLVLSDLRMPRMDGMELLQHVREEHPATEFVMLTGHGTVETAVEAMKVGAFDYLMKPVNLEELNLLVRRVFEARELKQENERLRAEVNERYGFENIIGNSAAMQRLFQVVRQVAPTKASVLVQGETGTGKELVARAIHYNSPRRKRPFVAVNCGALSQSLLESELFGHEKGSFTGAHAQRAGRFETADKGTIFLDEIGETSPEFQVKLLRILQEQEFERVGGIRPIKVDVRVVAATNRDLKKEVDAGRFREDLYYRLNVVKIDLPPLRDRQDDIPLLVHHFLQQFNREHGRTLTIAPKALQLLQNYSWPGNVRQLRTMMESISILTTGKEIQPRHLPNEVATDPDTGQHLRLKVGMTMRDAERELIRATLAELGGNKARAARVLGVGRKTLYRKLEEYQLAGEDKPEDGA